MLRQSLLRKFNGVRLSDEESKIFSALVSSSEDMGRGTVLRAAGGWVRDKLLGIESHDIDIALDNVPGDEFARFLYERESQFGGISSIGVVKENPVQSKHIRTATFRFFGFDIDMNNLRSETYTEDSRIPEVSFAKHPSEDALRRDFTINALYYNLMTKEVEDFTGSGLADLEKGIIRTPLPAAKTFVDDPLRVLRAIRFATRFGFELHADIVDAFSKEEVQCGLMNKVSRERIGIEVTKMIKHDQRLQAVKMLYERNLLHLILPPPTDKNSLSLAGVSTKDYQEWLKAYASSDDAPVLDFNKIFERIQTCKLSGLSSDNQYFLGLSLLFLESLVGKQAPNPNIVARLSMKLSSADSKTVGAILTSLSSVYEATNGLISGIISNDDSALAFGRIIKNTLGDNFPVALRVALAVHSDQESLSETTQKVERFLTQYSLLDCHKLKPVIDGAEICKLLDIKPSPVIQKLLALEFEMMFTGESDREKILSALRNRLAEIST
jgi:tRNA nucleotidyltransferase (CCA-adding enzyme)